MILSQNIRKGLVLKIDNQLFSVSYAQHVNPGKGGAFVRTKLKNLSNGLVTEKTIRSGEKIENAEIEKRKMQYLYSADGQFHFMDNNNYEQYPMDEDDVGDASQYLTENMEVDMELYEGKPINLIMPNFVVLEVTFTEPGLKGDTVSNTTKPATLETGASVQVPLFVNQGEKIKVDTRSNTYIERVK